MVQPTPSAGPGAGDAGSLSEFKARVREHADSDFTTRGHHPWGAYTPAAFRHYIRSVALVHALEGLPGFRTALDVGCAEGFFMDVVRERFGAEVWGVDLSPVAVAHVHQRYHLPVGSADAVSLPFRDGSFDLVYSTETIEHVPEPGRMLAELRRVSRGHVVVTTPVSPLRDHHPDYELAQEGHINDFDRATVERLFGRDARYGSFRTNVTLAAIIGVGRHLPSPWRDDFYSLDYRVSQRWGSPEHRLAPLRNRDWLIATTGTGEGTGEPAWACPRCRGHLLAEPAGLACAGCGARYPAAAGVPDFFSASAE